MEERLYQTQARNAVHNAFQKVNRCLIVLPTGTGKTIVFSRIAEDIVKAGGRVLILAHRGELLQQAADKLLSATGLQSGLEKAEAEHHDGVEMVTIGSVQTLMRESRLARFSRDHYDLIIVDEAHHILADSYQRVIEYFQSAKVLGVTATADRGDNQSLGKFFECLAYEYLITQAIRDGYLAKIQALTIPLQIDLTSQKVRDGDYMPEALDEAISPHLYAIAEHMRGHCSGRKTLAFLPLIRTCQAMTQVLQELGLNAEWVSGDRPDRTEVLARYASGDIDILCNSMLLTEGYDDPATDCVVCLRPTKIRPLYAQIIGRGTRIHPGKEHLLILDFLWMTDRHSLCRPASLICDNPDTAEQAQQIINESAGRAVDLDDALQQVAEKAAVHEREIALAKQLDAMKRKRSKLVDPLQYAASVGSMHIMDYQPEFLMDRNKPSQEQEDKLESIGINPEGVMFAPLADMIINDVAKRKSLKLATPKQVRVLERYGFPHVGEMSFIHANKIITRIAANGWRVPSQLKSAVNK